MLADLTPEQRKAAAPKISGTRLEMIFRYDPETGQCWRVFNSRRKQCEELCGTVDDDGYLVIYLDHKRYTAHQLAWIWMKGEEPPPEIDHHDNDRLNNRWTNLRAATRQQNAANSKLSVANSSGHKGVFWCKQTNRWRAGITVNFRWIHLGRFDLLEDAAAAYRQAALKHFGEFARC